jgi:hypothetical protein
LSALLQTISGANHTGEFLSYPYLLTLSISIHNTLLFLHQCMFNLLYTILLPFGKDTYLESSNIV